MQDFGTYTINTFLPPKAPLRININRGWEYIRITNKTPFALVIDFGSSNIVQFPEMYLEDLPLPDTFTGWLTITPRIDLTNTSQSISGIVTVGAWQKGELAHPQAQPLTQQAVNTTATGKPIFTATVGYGNTATALQTLNIFNPANSGVIGKFHSMKAFTNDNTGPTINIVLVTGSDVNLANPITPTSHSGNSSPPVSVMHCTQLDGSVVGGTTIEVQNSELSRTIDVTAFPDNYDLFPGNNIQIAMSSGSSGHIVRLTMKWTEDQIVPPTLVTGATAVASSIDNEGNPVGTSIIKSGITGIGTPIQIFNDGSSAWSVDASGTLHKVITTNLAANFIQLGQIGDTVEILGTGTIDQILNVTGASNLTGLLTAVAATFTGQVQPNQAGVVNNGSVSGTLTFFTPVWGTGLKIFVAVFSNYQSTGTPTLLFPSSATVMFFWSGPGLGTGTWQFFNGGSGLTARHLLTLGTAGAAGTDEGITAIRTDNIGQQFGPMDRIIVGSMSAAVNSSLIGIGQ